MYSIPDDIQMKDSCFVLYAYDGSFNKYTKPTSHNTSTGINDDGESEESDDGTEIPHKNQCYHVF